MITQEKMEQHPQEQQQKAERNITFTTIGDTCIYFENKYSQDIPYIIKEISKKIESGEMKNKNLYDMLFVRPGNVENVMVTIFNNDKQFKERLFIKLFLEEV